jgi:hypothetical protein
MANDVVLLMALLIRRSTLSAISQRWQAVTVHKSLLGIGVAA